MNPIVSIDDPNFVEKMNNWYISTSYQKCWKNQIPTYLSYFVYWCTKTKLNVEVNSVKYAGRYYYATEEFEKYARNAHKQYFKHGYPISVSNTNNCVMIYQRTFDEVLYYKILATVYSELSAVEFIEYFNKHIHFKFDDETEYYPGDDYFGEAIEREINQLFLVDPIPYSRS